MDPISPVQILGVWQKCWEAVEILGWGEATYLSDLIEDSQSGPATQI